jgi:hypothetical protein
MGLKVDPLSLLLGAVLGAASVLKFGTVQLDHPALLQSGWVPPSLDADALLALVEAKRAGTVNETDFAARKAELFGCTEAGCQAAEPPAAVPAAAAAGGGGDFAYTWEEVAQHSTPKDCWVGVHDEVYDFSCFWGEPDSEAFRPCYVHPGGLDVIGKWCGKDGTAAFDEAGHKPGIAQRKGIGHIVKGSLPPSAAATAAVASGGGAGWRCTEDECKWVGYHKDPRSWQKVIGTHTWFFIHSVAAKYPEHPTAADQKAMVDFIGFLGQLYPCKVCRLNLQQELRYPEINEPELGNAHGLAKGLARGNLTGYPTPGADGSGAHGKGYYGLHRAVQSREGLMMWLCRLHNIINRDTGNEEFECTPIGLDMVYLKNCGDCQVKKKPEAGDAAGEAGEAEEEEHAMLVWDRELYVNGALSAGVQSATDQFSANELEEMLQVAIQFHILSAEDAQAVRARVAAGESSFDQEIGVLEPSVEEVLQLQSRLAKAARQRAMAAAAEAKAAEEAAAAAGGGSGGDDDEEDWDM